MQRMSVHTSSKSLVAELSLQPTHQPVYALQCYFEGSILDGKDEGDASRRSSDNRYYHHDYYRRHAPQPWCQEGLLRLRQASTNYILLMSAVIRRGHEFDICSAP